MKSVSIIGSGPSGFYTAYQLVKKCKDRIPLNITIWEKLPTPFGLSRYGVAPDHPEVKNCEATFMELMEEANKHQHTADGPIHRINFVGNYDINSTKLRKLRGMQDAVVLSYGCGDDRKLGIPGEQGTIGVVSSRNFVNWYNSYPVNDQTPTEHWQTPEFWKTVKNVGIIGNGNVALDLTRVLLMSKANPDFWKQTDMNENVVNVIQNSNIKSVKVIGRRGYLESKFTNKEFRELWELEQYGIKGIIKEEFLAQVKDPNAAPLDRQNKRRLEMITEFQKPFEQRSKKYQKYKMPAEIEASKYSWEFDYLKTPFEILRNEDSKKIEKLVLKQNHFVDNSYKVDESKPLVEYPVDLLITSLGYKGKNIDAPEGENHIKWNDRGGYIANRNGAVLNANDEIIPGLFCSGWIKKGSAGVIATTMMDSFAVADEVFKYISAPSGTSTKVAAQQEQNTHKLVDSLSALESSALEPSKGIAKSPSIVSWSDWLALNRYELGKDGIRSKVLNEKDMFSVIKAAKNS
ncbi:hypothetical protein ACO0RG_004052 [Hanseniaspora osmophila]